MSSGDRLTRRIPSPAIARRVSDMMFKAWAKALHRSSELPITVRGARTATSELKFTVWRGEKAQQNSFLRCKLARSSYYCGDAQPQGASHYPIGDENIRLVRLRVVSIRRPNDLFSVSTEHRKTIEGRSSRHLLESGSVGIDKEEIEVAQLWIGVM